jgi:hypothetical protein
VEGQGGLSQFQCIRSGQPDIDGSCLHVKAVFRDSSRVTPEEFSRAMVSQELVQFRGCFWNIFIALPKNYINLFTRVRVVEAQPTILRGTRRSRIGVLRG